jgi:catechol 2,3-dioxygenase-like lactoylglutathione lyase family enzyme
MIRGIKIVSIPVSNQDVSLKFYTEKMGFKVATDQAFGPGQRWIELLIPGSDVNLALFTPPGHENRIGGFQPLTFWCDDVFATARSLKSKGVELAEEPKKETWGTMAKLGQELIGTETHCDGTHSSQSGPFVFIRLYSTRDK